MRRGAAVRLAAFSSNLRLSVRSRLAGFAVLYFRDALRGEASELHREFVVQVGDGGLHLLADGSQSLSHG